MHACYTWRCDLPDILRFKEKGPIFQRPSLIAHAISSCYVIVFMLCYFQFFSFALNFNSKFHHIAHINSIRYVLRFRFKGRSRPNSLCHLDISESSGAGSLCMRYMHFPLKDGSASQKNEMRKASYS